ncbi:MAG: iron ABC transporter permease [Candidatus Hydrogenedentes bacterium]|nr:iron ABC transporter permease [Candidatus Hydrogenedentota bacterium]
MSSSRKRPLQLLAWALLLVPTLAFSLAPLAILFSNALVQSAGIGRVAADISWEIIGRTLLFCVGSAGSATVVGVLAACLLGTSPFTGRKFLRLLLVLPLLIPPYLHAIGWTNFLRAGGLPVRAFSTALNLPVTSLATAVYSLPGAIFVLCLALFPIPCLFAEKALTLVSPTLVEAASVCGASPWQTWRYALWPFVRPAAISSGMIVFLLAGAELGVPTLLKVRVFNFEVLTQLSAFGDTRSAVMLSAPMVVVGLLVIFSEFQFVRAERQEATDLGSEGLSRKTVSARVLSLAAVGTLLLISFLLPLGSLVITAMDWNAFTQMSALALRPIHNSLICTTTATFVAMVVSLLLSLTLLRTGPSSRRATDGLLIVGFAVPGTIVALGLLAATGKLSFAALIPPSLLVIGGLLGRFQIVAFRGVSHTVLQIPRELFEAAAVEGAGFWQVIRYVILPIIRTPASIVCTVVFTLAFNEISSTILLYPPGGETLPIALYSIEANAPRAYVASLAVITLLVLVTALFLILSFVRTPLRRNS